MRTCQDRSKGSERLPTSVSQRTAPHKEDLYMLKRLILSAAVVAVTVMTVRLLPDMVRYLKIRSM